MLMCIVYSFEKFCLKGKQNIIAGDLKIILFPLHPPHMLMKGIISYFITMKMIP